jgi:hypothetical protein
MADAGAVCLAVGFAAVLVAGTVAHVEAQRVHQHVELAPNVRVGPFIEPCLRTMLGRSQTFRKTYIEIARRRDMSVSIAFDLRSDASVKRAATEVRRLGTGDRVAAIRLYTTRHVVELIAHEMEHVREQTEGVNLPLMAEIHWSGIIRVGRNAFETQRAVDVGLAVAREVGPSAERLCVPAIQHAALMRLPF